MPPPQWQSMICMDEGYLLFLMPKMTQRSLIWIGWLATITLAAWLRLINLEMAPIHADEATGARILAQRLEGQQYNFDPEHFHGPILGAVTAPIARIRGENSWPELSLYTLRIGPVLAGMATVLTPLLWIRRFGAAPALAAAALLASSPLLVYYNRIYIHESWLLLFGILALAALHRLASKPGWLAAALSGLCTGLMFATKETFAISILAWGAACACLLFRWRQTPFRQYLAPAALAAFVAFATGSLFYSDGFRDWQGVLDSVKTYFVYETTPGHEKPASYYLHLILWPKQALGIWWTEVAVVLLAATAFLRGVFHGPDRAPCIFLAAAVLAHLLIYSWIDYKTPWLMLLPWAHACLLAGLAFRNVQSLRPALKTCLALLLVGATAFQTRQSLHATGRHTNDERNPYAYVPTSRDAPRITAWLRQIQNLPGTPSINPVAVVGQEYWPLPWYLREFETIGYWPSPNETFSQLPVVLAMPGQAPACNALLQNSHASFPRTLRNNVPVHLYLRNDIWSLWINSPSQ